MTRRIALLLMFTTLAWPAPASGQPVRPKPSREQLIALLAKCKAEQRQADLVGALGADFAGLDLRDVDFRGHYHVNTPTLLRGANFTGCDLRGAEFGSARLDGANFTDANLEGTSFITAELPRAIFTRVKLKGAKIYQSKLMEARLAGVDFSAADITGSDFAGADLTGAILSGAKSDYGYCDYRGATLTGAKLARLNLARAQFQGADLRNADLTGCKLREADFTEADLTGAVFDGADLAAVLFRDAKGLSTEQRTALEGRAERWKFDFEQGVQETMENLNLLAYWAGFAAALALAAWYARSILRRDSHSGRDQGLGCLLGCFAMIFPFVIHWVGALFLQRSSDFGPWFYLPFFLLTCLSVAPLAGKVVTWFPRTWPVGTRIALAVLVGSAVTFGLWFVAFAINMGGVFL